MPGRSISVKDFIFDASAENFQQLALQNSQLGPVLVHFWSRKAGPSFRLYPLLEKLVESYEGSLLLVNIDADEQRSVARSYAITSVPTLKLFVDGKVSETLFGFQNEQVLHFMLDQYVASENDKIIHDALTLFKNGHQEKAYQALGKAALNDPGYYKLPLTIASLMRGEGRYREALELLQSLPESIRHKHGCRALNYQLEFEHMAAPIQSIDEFKAFVDNNMHELPAVAMLAACYASASEFEPAIKLFLYILQQDRSFDNDLGRRSIVRIFELLGDQHALTLEYREVLRQLL